MAKKACQTLAEYQAALHEWEQRTASVKADQPEAPTSKQWFYAQGGTVAASFQVHEDGVWIYDGQHTVNVPVDKAIALREWLCEVLRDTPTPAKE